MCRIFVEKPEELLVEKQEEHSVEKLEELRVYQYLNTDAGKYIKSPHEGYSVMLFGTRIGYVVNEGDLMEKFFNNYNKIK